MITRLLFKSLSWIHSFILNMELLIIKSLRYRFILLIFYMRIINTLNVPCLMSLLTWLFLRKNTLFWLIIWLYIKMLSHTMRLSCSFSIVLLVPQIIKSRVRVIAHSQISLWVILLTEIISIHKVWIWRLL